MDRYLEPTEIIDSDHPEIQAFARATVAGSEDAVQRAVRLYYAVRDGVWYDPYHPFFLPEHYRASNILKGRRGFCIPKASLLCALGRAAGIPSRPGFADVRNHLATPQLLEFLGSDLFVFHAFTEFYLNGAWIKATPAFNIELCRRHGVAPLEFDGRSDSIFQPFNEAQRKFMEYVRFHGSFQDIPVRRIVKAFEDAYGEQRVRGWIDGFTRFGDIRRSPFNGEDAARS